MTMEQTVSIDAPAVKIASVWGSVFAAFGINSWSDASAFMGFVASALAGLYTLCLLLEWVRKRRTKRTRRIDPVVSDEASDSTLS